MIFHNSITRILEMKSLRKSQHYRTVGGERVKGGPLIGPPFFQETLVYRTVNARVNKSKQLVNKKRQKNV